MTPSLALAAALLLTPASNPEPEPTLRIAIGDLDFARADHIDTFLLRVDTATRAFCAEHRAVVTPSHVGDPRFCEDGLRAMAVRALPSTSWRAVVRSGKLSRRSRSA